MENKIEMLHHEPLVYRIYDLLKKEHLGKENGIVRSELALQLGITERELRKITREINLSGELEKLVSTSHSCYMCETREECEKSIRTTYHSAVALFKKAKQMEKKVGLNGQIKMSVGDDLFEIVGTFEK